MAASPILSASPAIPPPLPAPVQSGDQPFPNRLTLELRNERVQIARDTLVNLPESVLVVMFPNGLILGPRGSLYVADDGNPSISGSMDGNGLSDEDDEDGIVQVDFDPNLLRYILKFYDIPPATSTDGETGQSASGNSAGGVLAGLNAMGPSGAATTPGMYPFNQSFPERRAYIVLREELDYFAIRSNSATADSTNTVTKDSDTDSSGPQSIKHLCGQYLVDQCRIFDALRHGRRRSIDDATQSAATAAASPNGDEAAVDSANVAVSTLEEASAAERQLVDMLCLAGFGVEDLWGYRAREPGRCCVVSVSMVRLVTDGTPAQMAAAHKLLVFWRKPARKCWWDGSVTTIGADRNIPVRIWSRRTWTLELALI
ncbi:hypothetical protein BDF19DRAFT_419061 [Syncephalis fuscata]|nr:hypothetical protein BDF19DRAFT_419061 [Syncephalis fuscata]